MVVLVLVDHHAVQRHRDPEVGQLAARPAVPSAVVDGHDVRRLDVAVHDALVVHVLQRFGEVVADVRDVLERHRTLLQRALEVDPLDELHHEIDAWAQSVRVVDTRVEKGDYAVVGEVGDHLGLRLLLADLIGADLSRREHLDGDVATESLIVGAPDGGHAAAADALDEVIPTSKRHADGRRVDDPLGVGSRHGVVHAAGSIDFMLGGGVHRRPPPPG